jgi:hypothetical protein
MTNSFSGRQSRYAQLRPKEADRWIKDHGSSELLTVRGQPYAKPSILRKADDAPDAGASGKGSHLSSCCSDHAISNSGVSMEIQGSKSLVHPSIHEFPREVGVVAASVPTSTPLEPFVDADAVAKFTGYDRRMVLRLTRDGLLTGYPPPGKRRSRNHWRYKLSEVDAAMRSKVDSNRRSCRPQGDRIR